MEIHHLKQPTGRPRVLYTGRPFVAGYGICADRLTYGVILECVTPDGQRYDVLVDRGTAAAIAAMSTRMPRDIKAKTPKPKPRPAKPGKAAE